MLRKLSFKLLILYFMILSYWMLFGFGRSANSSYMYNLKPFETINSFFNFNEFNIYSWMINIIGNIGVFIPFGFLIPIAIKKSYVKSIGIFLVGLTILELLQLVTRRGTFDIDDFILNSVGFTLGYIVFKMVDVYKDK